MEEKFTFFWSGPFSQWSSAPFTMPVVDGTEMVFSCAEQYMMWSKAILFGDTHRANLIMETSDPSKQKAHGRLVDGFDEAKWNAVSRDVVFWGNVAKFKQNAEHRQALYETIGTTLVEASPYDKIWGIGLAADDPRAQSRETWLGENRLGEVLTDVRKHIFGV